MYDQRVSIMEVHAEEWGIKVTGTLQASDEDRDQKRDKSEVGEGF